MKKILLTSIIAVCCLLCSCLASTYSGEDWGKWSSYSTEESVNASLSSSVVSTADEGDSSSSTGETDSSSSTEETDSSSSMADTQTTLLTAHFDYGLHVENRATLLLGGCSLFFDLEAYGIDRINAGDVVEVTYRGELYVLETYPSTVVTDYMEIVSIRVIKTNIVVVEVALDSNGKVVETSAGEGVFIFDSEGLNVVNQDGTYTLLEEQEVGTTLYATLKQGEEAEIAALYSYAPVAVSPHTCAPIFEEIQEPTCQETGIARILCTYCSYVFEEIEIPIVDCDYTLGGGECRWCGGHEAILLPCCICGSYTCNGHE